MRAASSRALEAEDFLHWGIVAAPQYLGRQAVADTFVRVAGLGPRGASPMVIPHRSLHAVSGTISQALGIKGPNMAAGGGPGHLADGLLAGLSLLGTGRFPGLWLVLTQWDPEPLLSGNDPSAICHGLALALLPLPVERRGPSLRLVPPAEMGAVAEPLPGIADLADSFSLQLDPSSRKLFRFDWGGGLEVAGTEAVRS
jgi:hypothetical protein